MFEWIKNWFRTLDQEAREKIKVLNKIKLFENCRQEDLVSIARECDFVGMDSGEKIIKKGNEGKGFYMIDQGRVGVYLENDTEPVATMGETEYVGEMSLLDKKPRSAHIKCEEGGRLLYFSGEGFRNLLKTSPKTSSKMLYVLSLTLSRRLRETNRQLTETRRDNSD